MGKCRLWAVMLAAMLLAGPGRAAVDEVEIIERVPFADGASFGEVGSYEKIRAIAHFALDPKLPANQPITDLALAPRDKRGLVTFSAEFILLRPIAAIDSSLFYDVNNRGYIAMLGQIDGRSPANNDPTSLTDAGDGFLMRHGFSLLFSAWTWDVAPPPAGVKPLIFSPPIAKGPKGATITGPIVNEFTVSQRAEITSYAGMRGLTYEPAIEDDPAAELTERSRPADARRPIDRHFWHFLPPEQKGGAGRVQLEGGFKPGSLYELRYLAKDPYVMGAGLAGVRDLLAFFRDQNFAGAKPPRHVMIFGISQSARVIGRMLQDGLNVDETGKLAFGGAYLQVPGAGGSAGFNGRFLQPTRHPSLLEEHDYPADSFPFATQASQDPVSGVTASRLDHARDKEGNLPKLIISNNSTEYWNRGASLNTTTPDGARDIAPAESARVYGVMGAQHYVGRSRTRFPYVNCVSTTDHTLAMRALLLALDRWVAGGPPPPDSAFPQISDGSLITVEAYDKAFPSAIGLTPPTQNLREPRLDFGPNFVKFGIADHAPPEEGPAYETRVPAPDADGNDRGGVRPLELEVPLGTHTGWNGRAPETGFAWATARFDGSFLPFARTEAERILAHDPRPSLTERYATREDFKARIEAAAAKLVGQGFLLQEDVARAVSENLGLYDRILNHDPGDKSCAYLYGG